MDTGCVHNRLTVSLAVAFVSDPQEFTLTHMNPQEPTSIHGIHRPILKWINETL